MREKKTTVVVAPTAAAVGALASRDLYFDTEVVVL